MDCKGGQEVKDKKEKTTKKRVKTMNRRTGRAWFFVVLVLILALAYTAFFGVQAGGRTILKGAGDIRFGIDIRGGVDVTFVPANGQDASAEQLNAVQAVMELRMVNLNITDYEIYTDPAKDQVIVRFPWKEGESGFDPQSAIDELGATAEMTFRYGTDPAGRLIITGAQVREAALAYDNQNGQYVVTLDLAADGAKAFGDATTELAGTTTPITIWMDDQPISTALVQTPITNGEASITGNFTAESAGALSDKINAGALPFSLRAASFSTISPTLGENSLNAMVIAGIVAFVAIFVFMVAVYRLPGFVAGVALLGQTAATIAFISGYFPGLNSFTLTLPGIAGIILAIGMGVDANVITAARIREELRGGKTLAGAVKAGFRSGLTPIIDGNVTILIVAVILIGAFGPTDGILAKLLYPVFFAFGAATTGAIYSFGYTLLIGVLLNFVMAVGASRVMLRALSRMKCFDKLWLYGAPRPGHAAKPQRQPDIIGSRKKFFTASAALLVVILLASVIFGVSVDIQFKGGALLTYGYAGEVDTAALRSTAAGVLGDGINLQSGADLATGASTFTISLPGASNVSTDQLQQLDQAFADGFAQNDIQQLEVSNVNATLGREFFVKSLVAVLTAFVLILVYIAIRFARIGGWSAGLMAIAALLHDLIVVYGVFVVCGIPLNSNFMAVVLTILGYSINDTVVVYDRIRENRRLYGEKLSFAQLVNKSVGQSLARTSNTTITTVTALAVLSVVGLLFGLSSISTFAFPMMVGMISGWYSSLCLSGSLWSVWMEKREARKKA